MKLHEIANQYKLVFDALENQSDSALVSSLDAIKAPLQEKATNIAKYIHHLEITQKAIDDEISRLQHMKKSLENREENMKNYLETNMKKCGISKIESTLFKIQFQKCPVHVDVINSDEIPDEYKIVKTEIVIDKIKIKNEAKLGVVIPGVQLIQDEKLVIK